MAQKIKHIIISLLLILGLSVITTSCSSSRCSWDSTKTIKKAKKNTNTLGLKHFQPIKKRYKIIK